MHPPSTRTQASQLSNHTHCHARENGHLPWHDEIPAYAGMTDEKSRTESRKIKSIREANASTPNTRTNLTAASASAKPITESRKDGRQKQGSLRKCVQSQLEHKPHSFPTTLTVMPVKTGISLGMTRFPQRGNDR